MSRTLSPARQQFCLTLRELGLYGVLSGSVTERLREIGSRSALGASPATLWRLAVRQGMMLAALGVAIGCGGAVLAGRALTGLVFGISWFDPATYAGVIVLVPAVARLACWLPAPPRGYDSAKLITPPRGIEGSISRRASPSLDRRWRL